MSVRPLRAKYTAKMTTPPEDKQFEVNREGQLEWYDGRVYTWNGVKYVCEDEDGSHSVSFVDDTLTVQEMHFPEPPPAPPAPPYTGRTGTFLMTAPLDQPETD